MNENNRLYVFLCQLYTIDRRLWSLNQPSIKIFFRISLSLLLPAFASHHESGLEWKDMFSFIVKHNCDIDKEFYLCKRLHDSYDTSFCCSVESEILDKSHYFITQFHRSLIAGRANDNFSTHKRNHCDSFSRSDWMRRGNCQALAHACNLFHKSPLDDIHTYMQMDYLHGCLINLFLYKMFSRGRERRVRGCRICRMAECHWESKEL